MKNYLTIDLESWAMPNIPEFIRLTSLQKKNIDAGNVRNSTLKILSLLKKYKTKLTFFIVGQIYEWYPEIIEKIANEGHEIAYHTHAHDALPDRDSLRKSLELSKNFIQKFRPIGFRAPRISVKQEYLKTLHDYGFKYDSSRYASYSEGKKIDKIIELPVTVAYNLPIGSGYFIGLLGNKIEFIYKRINKKGDPVISFLHNWQILKPANPSFPTKKHLLTHPYYFPYLANCSSTFEFLLENFTFKPMKNLI